MTEKLELGEREKVLEIGTGSGYQAAILARLCRRAFTVERHGALVRAAELRFRALGLMNIVSLFADGTKGWPEQAPFDRIIVTAASPEIPDALVAQLAPGGIMVLPVGPEYHDQQLLRVRRGESDYEIEELAWVRFVPMLTGLPRPGDTQGATRDVDDFAVR
jgi:protein-L-isoaspartate(D-aspartate) O-methyltransferase